jgi:hypothetical protein
MHKVQKTRNCTRYLVQKNSSLPSKENPLTANSTVKFTNYTHDFFFIMEIGKCYISSKTEKLLSFPKSNSTLKY